jgi:PAS domain-containing protein
MKTKNMKTDTQTNQEPINSDFFERLWERSWSYIKTVVDVVREPVLVLDKDFKVLVANEPFYRTFHVEPQDTESKVVYELGDGQWNIPALKKLLEDILPKNTFFKGFEVIHDFPYIGHKVMVLNARQIHFAPEDGGSKKFPPIILLAIEDITDMMVIAETLVGHTKQLEEKFSERTLKLEEYVKKLEKEVNGLKKDKQKIPDKHKES